MTERVGEPVCRWCRHWQGWRRSGDHVQGDCRARPPIKSAPKYDGGVTPDREWVQTLASDGCAEYRADEVAIADEAVWRAQRGMAA